MNENVNNKNAGENNAPIVNSPGLIFEENGTFCRVGSEDAGTLEVDLQSIKQKGVEVRNVSFAVVGFDENQQVVKSEMLLMDENNFNKFKAFIAKLNWND